MKAVIVTGASRGLGLAIAKKILHEGFRAILIARNETDEIGELLKQYSGACRFLKFDLGKIDEIHNFVETELRPEQEIYALVNNAAVGADGVLATMHNSEIVNTFTVNCIAPIILSKYVIRLMLPRKQGRIINISSVIATTGYSGLSVYAATKAALEGHSKSLAREIGRAGITVNCIAPGYMKTNMTAKMSEEKIDQIIRRSPMHRLVEVEDVASAVKFLLDESSKNITGVSIKIDAGGSI
jgi:3-oxoacyl-[acyl-carrier protein] reductase